LQRQRIPHRRALTACAAVAAAASLAATLALRDDARSVSFAADVQPIFDRKCTACHPVSYPYLDLRSGRAYDDLVHVSAATAPAFQRVLPGRPELSYLLTHPPDPSLRDRLTAAERETIAAWIREGARDN
jgi:uncharacterized membrane protein